MKPVLGLPGRNAETESWMSEVVRAAGVTDAEVASYQHWQDGSSPDLAREANRYPVTGRQLVIAKSMGTMVLLAAAEQADPRRAVLIGTPIEGYSELQIQALQALPTRLPCLFIQQTSDFTGSADALRMLLGEEATLQEVSGSDHIYADVEELGGLINGWQESLDG